MNARRWMLRNTVMVCGIAMAAPALAQAPVPVGRPAAAVDGQAGQRYQLAVMEGVLEAAVQQGARVVSRQWRAVSSEMLFISGNARARGFKLDNYGVFFDVEVPSMRQSVAWTWRQLDRDASGTTVALQTLRNHLKTIGDPAAKKDLDQAIRRLELQVGPAAKLPVDPDVIAQGQPGQTAAVVALPSRGPGQPPPPGVASVEVMPEDPGLAYTNEVKNALIDAMLDHSHALTIGPDEYLTVAAHDDADRHIGGADPYDAVTMLMRIKGADLQAFRSGRLTRAEAMQRIEIKEY